MSDWNRRTFLQAGAYGTAGLAIENKRRVLRATEKPWNAGTQRSLRKFRDPAPTVCRMCPSHCGILAFRDGDRVVQIQGAVGAPTNRGGICARGLAGLERLYDPERHLQPLRRDGPRGSGRWKTISWEEALAELERRLRDPALRKVLHLGQEELLVQELREVFAWDHLLVDRPLPGRPGAGSGAAWYGAPVTSPQASRARTLFLFGLRPFDGRFSVPLVKDLVEAQRGGAAVHVFDCVEGASGSITRWHPIAPGSEAAVAYGVARLILRWESYDAEALRTRLVPTGEGEDAEIDRIRTAVAGYTPETVQELTGLPAAQVVYLARRFAEETPALALADPASPAAPAAALLNHLVGSVNAPGGVATARGPYFVQALQPTATPERWAKDLTLGDERADLYWCVDANPAYHAPEAGAVVRALADPQKVGFLVAMDTHLTETAALADLFLPLATHLESWGLVEGALPDGRSYLFLQQPVTRPAAEASKLKDPATPHLALFEPWARPIPQARSLSDLLLQLARDRSEDYQGFADTRAYLGELLRKSWGPGSLEALAERGVWVSEEGRTPPRVVAVQLSNAIPPAEDLTAPDSLHLVLQTPATFPRTHPNTRWGREITHHAVATVHPDTASALGLADGDRVQLSTASGRVTLPLRTLHGIHPGVVAVPDGFGHTAVGTVARAEPTATPEAAAAYLVNRTDFLHNPLGRVRQQTAPAEPIWWSAADAGPAVRTLFPFRQGQDDLHNWGPLPVTVRKA